MIGFALRLLRVVEDENTEDEESRDILAFWHQKLAAFFHTCPDKDRQVQVRANVMIHSFYGSTSFTFSE